MQRRRSLDDLQRSYAASLRLRQVTEWTSRSRRLLAGKSSAVADIRLQLTHRLLSDEKQSSNVSTEAGSIYWDALEAWAK